MGDQVGLSLSLLQLYPLSPRAFQSSRGFDKPFARGITLLDSTLSARAQRSSSQQPSEKKMILFFRHEMSSARSTDGNIHKFSDVDSIEIVVQHRRSPSTSFDESRKKHGEHEYLGGDDRLDDGRRSALPSSEHGDRFQQQLGRAVGKGPRLLYPDRIANGDRWRMGRHGFRAASRGRRGRGRLAQQRRLIHVVSGGLLVVREHRRGALMLVGGQRSESGVKVVRRAGHGDGGGGDTGWISGGCRGLEQPLHGERAVLRGCGGGWERLRFAGQTGARTRRSTGQQARRIPGRGGVGAGCRWVASGGGSMQIGESVQGCRPSRWRVRRWVQPSENDAPLERRQPRPRRRCRPSPKFARRPTDEHVLGTRIQHPVISFAGVVVMAGHFDETLVQRQVVPDRVLPSLLVVLVIREMAHYVLVDTVQGESFLRALANGHHDQRVVTVRGFLAFLLVVRSLPILGVLLLGRRVDGGGRVSRAIQGRRLGTAVPGHVEIARILALVDVADLRGRCPGERRCWGARARLRQDATNTETALQGNSRRWRSCHSLLLARSFHIHHSFHASVRKSCSPLFRSPLVTETLKRRRTTIAPLRDLRFTAQGQTRSKCPEQ